MPLYRPVFFCLSAALLVLIWTAASTRAQEKTAQIGTIIEVEGTVALQSKNHTQPMRASNDMPVHLGDTIETGPYAKVHLLFIDDTELTLGAGTLLKIDEYVFDPDSDRSNKGKFNFLRGTFVFISGLLGKTDNPDVTLETSYGTIGLRGTTVWGGIIDNEFGVYVAEGTVSVSTKRGRVLVRKGLATTLKDRNTAPGRPREWSQARLERAQKMVRLKRAEAVKQRIEQIREKRQGRREDLREKLKEELKDKTPEERKKFIEDKREDIQERREERKEEIKDRIEEKREERREHKEDRRPRPPSGFNDEPDGGQPRQRPTPGLE